jgi:hypothetical protein
MVKQVLLSLKNKVIEMPMSATIATALANLIASNTPIAALASPNRFFALHHEDPTKNCTANELNGDGYARVQIGLEIIAALKGKDIANDDLIVFPIATGTKAQQIKFVSIWTDAIAGIPISYAALEAPANWNSGSALSFSRNAFVQLIRDTI